MAVNNEADLATAIKSRQSNIALTGHVVLTGNYANGTNLLPALEVPTTITASGGGAAAHGGQAGGAAVAAAGGQQSLQVTHRPPDALIAQGFCTTLGGLCILDAKQLGRIFYGAGPWIQLSLFNLRLVNGNSRNEGALQPALQRRRIWRAEADALQSRLAVSQTWSWG